jgi:putative FmdB family regulatory protein
MTHIAALSVTKGSEMATFQYRCNEHDLFDISRPIGTADAQTPCPTCGNDAVRVFTAPRLRFGSASARALLDRTEKSRSEPDVVSALPGRRPRRTAPVAQNPALQRLPRP